MRTLRLPDVLTKSLLVPIVATMMGAGHTLRSNGGAGASSPRPFHPSVVATTLFGSSTRVGDLGQGGRHNGRYVGFDTDVYPGDGAMLAWRHDESPYQWVGYYLTAPCHKDVSWAGKRATLTEMGWGLAVIYVGQQIWDVTATRSRRRRWRDRRTATQCSRTLVTAARGTAEAKDAIEKTLTEGFPLGTTVFLDLEHMDAIPQAMRDYYRAWTAYVLADGRYRPGIYTHTYNADQVYADVRTVYDSIGGEGDPPFWVAGHPSLFSVYKAPSEVGHHFAVAWQGLLDVFDTRNGVRLPIDVSVASVPSPSEEYALNE